MCRVCVDLQLPVVRNRFCARRDGARRSAHVEPARKGVSCLWRRFTPPLFRCSLDVTVWCCADPGVSTCRPPGSPRTPHHCAGAVVNRASFGVRRRNRRHCGVEPHTEGRWCTVSDGDECRQPRRRRHSRRAVGDPRTRVERSGHCAVCCGHSRRRRARCRVGKSPRRSRWRWPRLQVHLPCVHPARAG